jgi:alkylhydroperoxidase family enzyme
LSAEEINTLYEDPLKSPLFSEQEKVALRFAEEVTKLGEPTLPGFAALKQHFRPDQMVELAFLVGFWNMWNRFTDTFKIDLEEEVLQEIETVGVGAAHRRLRRQR